MATKQEQLIKPLYLSIRDQVPILFTIDFDGEAGMAAMHGWNKLFWVSRGEFEARVGVERLLKLLKLERIKAIFCVVGEIAKKYPQLVKAIAKDGHEIAVHGWTHRPYVELTKNEEEKEIVDTKTILEKITGHPVIGHRTPLWNPSTHTIALLVKHGFRWNSDFLNDELPYFHVLNGKKTNVIEIPPNSSLNDWAQLTQFRENPTSMFQTWKDEFDLLYKEQKMFCLTLHPLDIARGARIIWLQKLIRYIKRHKQARFTTCGALINKYL